MVTVDPQAGHHAAGRVADDVDRGGAGAPGVAYGVLQGGDLRKQVSGAVTRQGQDLGGTPGGGQTGRQSGQGGAAAAVTGHQQHGAGHGLIRAGAVVVAAVGENADAEDDDQDQDDRGGAEKQVPPSR